MTKKEQIEEMAEIVDKLYNVYTTPADDIAEGLYNAGYCKIPKDAVVLTREEWECLHNDYGKALYNARQQVRKETAKEIISFIESKDKIVGKYSIYTKLLQELKEKYVEVNDEK